MNTIVYKFKNYRTFSQYIVEWLIFGLGIMLFFLGILASFGMILLGITMLLIWGILRFGSQWSRKWVEVRVDGLKFGEKFIPWTTVKSISVARKMEATRYLSDIPVEFSPIIEVFFHSSITDVNIRFKDLSTFNAFLEALNDARKYSPELDRILREVNLI